MGYCIKCGQWVEDSAKFCQACGEQNLNYYPATQGAQPVTAQPVPESVPNQKRGMNVMAIVAMALSELGVPGIILAAIALKRAKSGNLRVPLKPLAKAALIVSIICAVLWLAYMIFWVLFAGKIIINNGIDYSRYIHEFTYFQ